MLVWAVLQTFSVYALAMTAQRDWNDEVIVDDGFYEIIKQ